MVDRLEFVIGAKDQFSKSFGKLRSILPSIKTMAIATGAAFAGLGTAIFAMTKSTATAYDQVQKLSDRLGVTTGFLSSMAHAANISGVEITTMNKAVEMTQVRIQEASKGVGLAVEAFENLNVSLRDSTGELRTAEDIMPDLAEAFTAMTNATERTAAAYQIFGMRGTSMLQMFKDGKDGLKALTDEAERFGLVVSEKAGANAAEFNDSLTRLMGAFRGLKNTLAEDFLPILSTVFDDLANKIANNRDAILGTLKLTAEGFVEFINVMVKSISTISEVSAWINNILFTIVDKIGADNSQLANSLRGFFKKNEIAALAFKDSIDELRSTVSGMFSDWITLAGSGGGAVPGVPSPDEQQAAQDIYIEWYQEYLNDLEMANAYHNETILAQAQALADAEKNIQKLKADAIKGILQNLYSVGAALGKEFFEISKAAGIADTIISTYLGAQRAFTALAGIPIVGPALGAAAAAAAIIAGMARVAQIQAQEYPSAHGGLTSAPKEQTYMIDAGERILSPQQNQDLLDFMQGNGGNNVSGNNFNFSFPDTDLSSMSRSDVEDFVEQKLIPGLNDAINRGVMVRT